MEWETFKPVRRKTAQTIFEALKANPPEGCIAVHEPDGIGATGLDFGDAGYVLVQVELAGELERAAAAVGRGEGGVMDKRNLIHPMTAGDLVESACVLAIQERGMGGETETTILECVRIDAPRQERLLYTPWPQPGARADVTFRDRQTGDQVVLALEATTPLLLTRITR